VIKLLRELVRRSDTSRVVVDKPGLHLELTAKNPAQTLDTAKESVSV
jgi:hypothetical protein